MDEALVLGIGNVLWADEGFGVRCVESFHEHWDLPAGAAWLDGGTQGLYLLPYLQATRRLIIFDSIGTPSSMPSRCSKVEIHSLAKMRIRSSSSER